MFADMLQLQLRRSAPGELSALHSIAAGWYAEHGHAVEAVRHAQAAQDWSLAARLPGLVLNGQGATARELLAGFSASAVTADAELATLRAGYEVTDGSLEAAERKLAPANAADAADAAPLVQGAGEDLRTLALVSLGAAELWFLRTEEAERHLEQAVAPAHRIGRPFPEAGALAHGAWAAGVRSFALAVDRSTQATELDRRHGWTEEPIVAVAYLALGVTRVWQMRLEEAEPLLDHAELQGSLGGWHPPRSGRGWGGRPPEEKQLKLLREPLTDSETRVLRYLPTNLSAPEIAGQLSVSVNTVRTHMRHVYEKLGAHRRAGAVERARVLGLLAPSPRRA